MWAREYFNSNICYFNHVIETYDGGYAIAALLSDVNLPVIRLDANGNVLWTSGGAFYYPRLNWIDEISDNSLIATGAARSYEAGSLGLVVEKISVSGSVLWAKIYDPSNESDVGVSITPLPDNGFAICGYRDENIPWIIRTDSYGDTLWTRTWDDGWARARRVVYYEDGLTVFADGGLMYGPLLLRYDMDGNLEWVQDYSLEFPTSYEWGGSLCLTPGGSGYTFVTDWYSWMVQTDWSGNEQWREEVLGEGHRVGLCLSPTMDGGYIFSGRGSYWGEPLDALGLHSSPADTGSTWDGWLVKMDAQGQEQWFVYNSQLSRDNYFNCVQQLSQGGYIVAGQIRDASGGYNYNGYLLRYAPETGIEGDEPASDVLTLTPSSNPFSSSVSIICEGDALPSRLMVYDITGRLIRSLSDREGSSFLWDGRDGSGEDVPTGTYLVRGAIDGQATSIRVVKL